MIDLNKALAVQSYCFRHFKENQKVASLVRELGLDAIELCAVHADFANPAVFDGVIKVYRDAGVRIVSIGVQPFGHDLEKERRFFDFARLAGVKVISADFKPALSLKHFDAAAKLGDDYDINLAIHNHGGYHWLGSAQILQTVFESTSPRIGLMLDTAWALDARVDPVKTAKQFGKRLYGLHVKDFIFDRARKSQDVIIGTGNLNLPGLLAVLKEVDFGGAPILEYEGDKENPVPALKECVAAFRKAASHG